MFPLASEYGICFVAGDGSGEHVKCYRFSAVLETVLHLREQGMLALGELKGISILIYPGPASLTYSRNSGKAIVTLRDSWDCFSP